MNFLLNPLKEDSMLNKSIGKGVQDHTNLRVNAFTNKKTGSLNEIYYSSLKKTVLGAKHLFGQPTLMRGTGATSAVQLDLNRDGMIDTRIHIVQYIDTGRHDIKEYFSEKSEFSLSITPIFPESRGEITINNGALCVNPGYLSSSEDKKILKSALDFCIKILKTSPLSNHVSEIENEGLILDSPDDFVSNNYYSGAHLIGGLHDAVDSSFNFKGLENLFVCDASVLPCFPSSNIHSSIVLLSSIFSEKFISKYS